MFAEILFLLFTFGIILPTFLYFSYTLLQVVPTLAVVANHAPTTPPKPEHHTNLPLLSSSEPETETETETETEIVILDARADVVRPRPFWATLRESHPLVGVFFLPQAHISTYTRSLRAQRRRLRFLGYMRGYGVYLLIALGEGITSAVALWSRRFWLAVILQTIVPLVVMPHLYALWTHVVLADSFASNTSDDGQKRKKNGVLRRIPAWRATQRKTGLPLTVYLAGKALIRTFIYLYGPSRDFNLRRTNLFGIWGFNAPTIGVVFFAEALLVMPAHLVLTRIQASMLLDGEEPILGIDVALSGEGLVHGKGMLNETIGVMEALRSFGNWKAWGLLALLYTKILLVVVVLGGILMYMEFWFYIGVAMTYWRF